MHFFFISLYIKLSIPYLIWFLDLVGFYICKNFLFNCNTIIIKDIAGNKLKKKCFIAQHFHLALKNNCHHHFNLLWFAYFLYININSARIWKQTTKTKIFNLFFELIQFLDSLFIFKQYKLNKKKKDFPDIICY